MTWVQIHMKKNGWQSRIHTAYRKKRISGEENSAH